MNIFVNVSAGFIPPFKHIHLKAFSWGGKFSGGKKMSVLGDKSLLLFLLLYTVYVLFAKKKKIHKANVFTSVCIKACVCVCVDCISWVLMC